MKFPCVIVLLMLCLACSLKSENKKVVEKTGSKKKLVEIREFQRILDSANLNGSILIYDLEKAIFYSNNFTWAKRGKLPASTFKIPNSMIALETGVVEDDSTLFKWNGEKRALKIWEQDLIFRDAFHYSCVPCYQQIARKIGEDRMKKFLNNLSYGAMKVDSSNIDIFWLEGDSKITQFQQIDFLNRFYHSKLPISGRTERIMKGIMVMQESSDYKLSGKTGWAIRNGQNNGWFVGFVETNNNVYFFATNIEPNQNFDMNMFTKIRKEVTYSALIRISGMEI